MIATHYQEPSRMPEYRIGDSESMQNKLLYLIRTGNMNAPALDKLQSQCTDELYRLRSELDLLLQELRDLAKPADYADRESIAA
ncbi:hypothetical protein [Cohnella sp. GCM10027633]|uniref:hypothetical protein n=1 Tax=unclassified Cohnella TaxID=2636738 RepID=UPI003645A39C